MARLRGRLDGGPEARSKLVGRKEGKRPKGKTTTTKVV